MKQATHYIKPGTGITFHRGSISYEGTVRKRTCTHGIVFYSVDVNAPGAGPTTHTVDIHDGQIDRVFA